MNSDSRRRDERLMRRALALATLGRGTAMPNPLVGAVVARDGRVLGQGYHRRPGEPHAEVMALSGLGARARGATLYTNLEPCCHTGRTPPCVEEILRSGVSRVVASMRDPNPLVDGGGLRALRKGGVDVEVGILAREARRLNEGFVKHTRTGSPLVTLKTASTLDGRIATRRGDSKWITSAELRRHARLMRHEHDAILVGIRTVLADDPRLDRRPPLPGGAPFSRIVLDTTLRLPMESRLVATAKRVPVVLFCSPRASAARRRRLSRFGVEIEEAPERNGKLNLRAVLRKLGERGVTRLLVEGGGELHASFLEARAADRFVLYLAPRLVGGRDALPMIAGLGRAWMKDAGRLKQLRSTPMGDGWLIEGSIADEKTARAAKRGA